VKYKIGKFVIDQLCVYVCVFVVVLTENVPAVSMTTTIARQPLKFRFYKGLDFKTEEMRVGGKETLKQRSVLQSL
jgi:hypothetical protein